MAQIAYYSKFLSRTLNKNQAALRPVSLYTNVDLCVIYLYPQKNDRIYTIWKFEKVTLTGSGGQDSGPPLWEWTNYLRWIYRPFLKLLNMIDRSAEADTVHRRRFVHYYFLSYPKSHRIYTIFMSS